MSRVHRPLRLTSVAALAFSLSLAATGIALAQPDPVLTITDAGPAPPFSVSFILDHNEPAHGWALGMCHDPAGLEVFSVGLGADGSTVNGGMAPDFVEIELFPNGWTIGVVISLTGAAVLPPGTGYEIGEATYVGLADGAWDICPCDTLGTPPVATVIVYDGASFAPVSACATVTVDTALIHEFRRGDVNIDGFVDIADAIVLLEYQFIAGPLPPCLEAADIDDDGDQDIADVVVLLTHLFSGGPPPASPYPDCGLDPTADCDASACP